MEDHYSYRREDAGYSQEESRMAGKKPDVIATFKVWKDKEQWQVQLVVEKSTELNHEDTTDLCLGFMSMADDKWDEYCLHEIGYVSIS